MVATSREKATACCVHNISTCHRTSSRKVRIDEGQRHFDCTTRPSRNMRLSSDIEPDVTLQQRYDARSHRATHNHGELLSYLIEIFLPGAPMIKSAVALAATLICGPTYAGSTCADIHGSQSYPPLSITSGTICFVQEPVLDPKTRESIGVDAISLYYIANEGVPAKRRDEGFCMKPRPGKS